MSTLLRHYTERDLHVVLDNVSSHKSRAVQRWLEQHPRVSFRFVHLLVVVEPGRSLLQLAEQGGDQRVFPTKSDLVIKLLAFVEKFNREEKRFHWTKTPEQIFLSLERLSGH